jgi:hypothetical protein
MKVLADGNQVTDRSYYFLLDWNEKDDWSFLADFGKQCVRDLTLEEYKILWVYATQKEIRNWGEVSE